MFDFWRINKKVKTDYKEDISGKISSDNINKILGDSLDIIEKKVFVINKKEFELSIFAIDGLVDYDKESLTLNSIELVNTEIFVGNTLENRFIYASDYLFDFFNFKWWHCYSF